MDVVKQKLQKAGFQVYEPQESDESDDDDWMMKDGKEHPSEQVCNRCLSILSWLHILMPHFRVP